jgi:HEAT repeat protein
MAGKVRFPNPQCRGRLLAAAGIPAVLLLLSQTAPLSQSDEADLKNWQQLLVAENIQPKFRRAAASSLLRKPWPQAKTDLLAVLTDSKNRAGQVAVAAAIANETTAPPEFVPPLFEALKQDDPELQRAASDALVIYATGPVLADLAKLALDANLPTGSRSSALGCCSTPPTPQPRGPSRMSWLPRTTSGSPR